MHLNTDTNYLETEKLIQFWEKPNLLPKRMEKSGNEDDFQPSRELWNTFNNHCVLLLLKNFQLHLCVCFTSICCAIWKNVKKMKKLFLYYAIASVYCIQTKKYKFQSTWN